MKKIFLILSAVVILCAFGCESNSVEADPTGKQTRTLPPGQKPKDVLLPINKS